jgi:hypothetical protein
MFFSGPNITCISFDVRCSELSALCDVLTMEIEHVNCDILEELEKGGAQVEPSSRTVRTIQDKFLQKQHMVEVRMCGITFNRVLTSLSLCAICSHLLYSINAAILEIMRSSRQPSTSLCTSCVGIDSDLTAMLTCCCCCGMLCHCRITLL